MKVLCLILALIIPLQTPYFVTAKADAAVYARALQRDVYFCAEKSLASALFCLPYTYYVRVLADDGEWLHVCYAEDSGNYQALYGYCLKSKLSLVDTPPEVSYLSRFIPVTYVAESPEGTLPTPGQLTVDAAFYGTYYSGPTAYSYVLCQGKFGYVGGANDNYPLLPVVTQTQAEPPKQSNTPATVIVGVTLAALGVVIALLFLFVRKKEN